MDTIEFLQQLRVQYGLCTLTSFLEELYQRYDRLSKPDANDQVDDSRDDGEIAPEGTYIDIDSAERWHIYRDKLGRVQAIENFFNRDSGVLKSIGPLWKKYKSDLEKGFNMPKEFDEDTSEDVAGQVAKLIKKRITPILTACSRGIKGSQVNYRDRQSYQRFMDELEQYLQRICVEKIEIQNGSFFDDVMDKLSVIASKPTKDISKDGWIDEIEVQPHRISFVNNDDEVEDLYIEGKCVVLQKER